MSRIGKKPVVIPNNVEIGLLDNILSVKGPKGKLSQEVHRNIEVKVLDNLISVSRLNDSKFNRSLHGLTRSLIANMVEGVVSGFEKTLEINGVGYRAKKQGNDLIMSLGFSHPVVVSEVEGISIDVPSTNKVVIRGIDKQKVGQFAANVRIKRPPEPYKGKGIKYSYEIVRRKEGKAGKSTKK